MIQKDSFIRLPVKRLGLILLVLMPVRPARPAQHGGVQLLADEHQARGCSFAVGPGTVEIGIKTAAHALHQQTHLLARQSGKALDAQHAMLLHDGLQGLHQALAVHGTQVQVQGVEGIVVMVFVMVVVAVLVVDRQLGGAMLAQQHVQGHLALHGFDHLHTGRYFFGHQGTHLAELFGRDQIGLGQHHQVGGRELILEQLMQAGVVVQIGVGLTLFVDGMRVMGELAGGRSGRVDHGDHGIDGEDIGNIGPLEGLDQGLGQGQATGFDQQHIDVGAALGQCLHDGEELFLHGAAHAAVGQLVDLARLRIRAAFFLAAYGTGLEDFAVNAQFAELVDDDATRRPLACSRIWRISVVLPLPRKPVTMVAGILVVCMDLSPVEESKRNQGRFKVTGPWTWRSALTRSCSTWPLRVVTMLSASMGPYQTPSG
jgi:hypothetical protein